MLKKYLELSVLIVMCVTFVGPALGSYDDDFPALPQPKIKPQPLPTPQEKKKKHVTFCMNPEPYRYKIYVPKGTKWRIPRGVISNTKPPQSLDEARAIVHENAQFVKKSWAKRRENVEKELAEEAQAQVVAPEPIPAAQEEPAKETRTGVEFRKFCIGTACTSFLIAEKAKEDFSFEIFAFFDKTLSDGIEKLGKLIGDDELAAFLHENPLYQEAKVKMEARKAALSESN